MSNERSNSGVVGLVAVTAGLTVALHLLGSVPGMAIDFSDSAAWLQAASAELVVGAVLRHIGLALGYWVLATTVLYLIAGVRGRRRPAWVRVITLPFVRRLVDRTLATALAATIVATPLGPALAEEPAPPPIVYDASDDGIPVPHVRPALADTENEATPHPAPAISPETAAEDRAAAIPSPAPPETPPAGSTAATARVYTVQSGDNLWAIAEEQTAALGSAGDDVTAYWRSLIELNRPTLRSGDPNLIYPGEIISLPEISP